MEHTKQDIQDTLERIFVKTYKAQYIEAIDEHTFVINGYGACNVTIRIEANPGFYYWDSDNNVFTWLLDTSEDNQERIKRLFNTEMEEGLAAEDLTAPSIHDGGRRRTSRNSRKRNVGRNSRKRNASRNSRKRNASRNSRKRNASRNSRNSRNSRR
jgi:hypothetical protein